MKLFIKSVLLVVSCVSIVSLIQFYYGSIPAYTAALFIVLCVTPDIVTLIFEDHGEDNKC